jgi:GTP cyclohydrolase I
MRAKNQTCEHTGGHTFLKIFGGVAVALLAWGAITQLHDIRRYIKMMRM